MGQRTLQPMPRAAASWVPLHWQMLRQYSLPRASLPHSGWCAGTGPECSWHAVAFQHAGAQWLGCRGDSLGQKCQWVGSCETEVSVGGTCSVMCNSILLEGPFGQRRESPKWANRTRGGPPGETIQDTSTYTHSSNSWPPSSSATMEGCNGRESGETVAVLDGEDGKHSCPPDTIIHWLQTGQRDL